MRRTVFGPVLALVVAVGRLAAQADSAPEPLTDNSFLIEEAYNQDPGVVQEISNFTRTSGGNDLVYSLTQEWPVGGVRNQLSYTIPLEWHAPFDKTGLGDIQLNYRYQLFGAPGSRALMAPRLTAILPAGHPSSGRGSGSFGVQMNLPFSFNPSPRFATHWNAGFTVLPSAEDATGSRATAVSFNLGASAVWLVRPLFNFLLETIWVDAAQVVAPGRADRAASVLLSPGFRWGFNARGGLQIVTGAAYGVSLNDASRDQLFLYLSFEHPFRHIDR